MEQQRPIDMHSLLEMIEQESATLGPKITIYFSVPHASDFAIIGRAELKGHIHTVAKRLENLGAPAEFHQSILQKLRTLLTAEDLWTRRSDSYAIYCSASILRWYALPLPVRDDVCWHRRVRIG